MANQDGGWSHRAARVYTSRTLGEAALRASTWGTRGPHDRQGVGIGGEPPISARWFTAARLWGGAGAA